MRNEIIFDKWGVPDIMVVFTPEELNLPDTLKGKVVKEYAISKYPNTLIHGIPYSMPYQPPAVLVNRDEVIGLCEAKGPGWHLLTNDEWAALAHQSYKKGTIPRGNTAVGKSHSHPNEMGTRYLDANGKTLAGSGPITWNHDHTAEGVADLCGNVWEHVGGVRLLDGQIQIIPNNEAAAGADQSKYAKDWKPINTMEGDPIYYHITDDKITLEPTPPTNRGTYTIPFKDLDESIGNIPKQLIDLALYPMPGYDGPDTFTVNTDGEQFILRGGYWYNANAGLFNFHGDNSRTNSLFAGGFRSAQVRYQV